MRLNETRHEVFLLPSTTMVPREISFEMIMIDDGVMVVGVDIQTYRVVTLVRYYLPVPFNPDEIFEEVKSAFTKAA